MGFLTKYGTIWGQIPQTAGRVFWVAPGAGGYVVDGNTYSASDDNDGLSPERALALLDRGINLADQNGDVVVALPGTHTPGASLAMDTAGVTLTGLPGGAGNRMKQKTTIAAVTGDQNINVTAASCEIAFLNLIPVSTDSAIDISAAGDNCVVHDCMFDMATPAVNAGTIGIDLIGAASNCNFYRNYFECDGAQGPAIVAGASLETLIESCIFSVSASTWVSSITQAAAGRRLTITDCIWSTWLGAITNGILGTTGGEATMIHVIRCIFGDAVAAPLQDYDVGDAEIAECYASGLGAGDGGAIITATS